MFSMTSVITPIAKSILLVASGMLLLRLAGRKSISQLTVGQTVVMIAIGSIIIEPIITERIFNTLVASLTFVLFLVGTEYLEMKFPFMENFLTGKAQVVIADGKIVEENLKKQRLTVDKLEVRLRQQGIANITDVKTATLEPNGQLGYELYRSAQPLTRGEFEKAIGHLFHQLYQPPPQNFNIFDKAKDKEHDKDIPPEQK